MSTWYEITHWNTEIKAVEVVKDSPAFVTLAATSIWNERREAKHTSSGGYYPSFQEAKDALIAMLSDKIDRHQKEVERLQRHVAKVEVLTEAS